MGIPGNREEASGALWTGHHRTTKEGEYSHDDPSEAITLSSTRHQRTTDVRRYC